MRTALKVFSKVLAFVLVFVLGFLTCVGAIVGVGYFVYNDVTLDDIENLGGSLGTENIFKEDATVDLTSLSLSQLIDEINELSQMSEILTTEMLVDRYGLILSEQVQIVLNNEMQSIPLKDIFSGEGLNKLLGSYTIGSLVLNYTYVDDDPEDDIPGKWYSVYNKDNPADNKEVEGIEAVLCGYTFDKFLEPNVLVEDILGKITVSSILELHSEEFTTAYIGDEQITLTEPAVIWFYNDGVSAESMISAIAPMNIKDLSENINSLNISDFLGYISQDDKFYSWQIVTDAPQGKHLSLTVQDGLTAEFVDLNIGGIAEGGLDDKISGLEIAKVLELTYNSADGSYTDKDGNKITGVVASLANKTVGTLSSEIGKIKVGEIAGFTPIEKLGDGDETITEWYEVYDAEHPENNKLASGILASFADLSVDQMTDSEALSDQIQTLVVSSVLDLEEKTLDKVYIKEAVAGTDPVVYNYAETDITDFSVWYTKDGTPADKIMSAVAASEILKVGETIESLEIAKFIGLYKNDADGKYYSWDVEKDEFDNDIVVLTLSDGITSEFVDLTVNGVGDGGLDDKINDLEIYKVLGYTREGEEDNYTYYDQTGTEVTGIVALLAGKTVGNIDQSIDTIKVGEVAGYKEVEGVWYDENDQAATGILASLADLTVNDLSNEETLSTEIKSIEISTVLGYTKNGDKYFNGSDEVVGVMAVLAGKTVGELDSSVDTITIAEIAGYTDSGRTDADGKIIWLDKDGNEVSGILPSLAHLTVDSITNNDTLTAEINNIRVSVVLGYTKVGDKYYNGDDEVTGVMSVIADKTVSELDSSIGTITVAQIAGYTEGVGTDGQKIWLDKDGNEVDGILSSLAELTVDNMTNESELSDKIKTIKVYSALGYTENNGKYFNGDKEVTGVMAVLADKTVGEIDSSIGTITIAQIAGYTDSGRIDSNGDKIWLDKDENEVSGILSKLADLMVDDLTNESVLSSRIQNIQVADVLNYTLGDDGNYYKNVEGSTEPVLVTGAMSVIAGTKVANIQETLDEAYMGELIGYTGINPIYDTDGETILEYEDWLNGTQSVHVLMKKVSNTKFKDVGNLTNTLTLEDLVPEEERTGFISLVPAQTGINDIASEITKAFNEYSLLRFIECDAITFEADTPAEAEQRKNEAIENLTNNGYGNMTLPQLIEAISNIP